MKNIRVAAGIVASAALILGLAGCASGDTGTDPAGSTEPLKMGVINNFPPFEYMDGDELVGFDIEIVEAILAEEGLVGEWQVMGFDGLIPALQSNQVDLAVSDISVNEERKAVVDFTDAYYEDGQSLAVAVDSDIQTLDDLKGKTIVSTQGTSGNVQAQKVAEEYGATVQTLTASDALFLAVTSGQADALVIDTSSIQYRMSTDSGKQTVRMLEEALESAPTAIAVPKGNSELVATLNSGLKKIRDNGTYDEIFSKYLGAK